MKNNIKNTNPIASPEKLPVQHDFDPPKVLIEWGPGQPPATSYIPPNNKAFHDKFPLRVPLVVRLMWDDGSAAGFHPDGTVDPCDESFFVFVEDSNADCVLTLPTYDAVADENGMDPFGNSGYEPGGALTYCYIGTEECENPPPGLTLRP